MHSDDAFFGHTVRILLSAVCLTATFVGAASAQSRPAPPAGPPHSLVLPRELVAGAPATLSVLDVSGRLVPGINIEASGGEKFRTDATGRAEFTAPASLGKFLIRVEGQMISDSAPIVAAGDPSRNGAAGVQLTSAPEVLDVRNRFDLVGTGFRGYADENQVAIGGKPAVILAASPTSIVALPDPGTSLGSAVLSVQAANQGSATASAIVVAFDAIMPPGPLEVGQQANFTVRVRGTREPLKIEVANFSPTILQLPGGNPLRLTTSGGETNEAQFAVVPLAAGKYLIRARLAPTD